MAEYYPLLARAVASLPQSTPESRRAIYERARKALLGNLKAADPPIAAADIERESKALDDAAAKIEAEQTAAAAKLAQAPKPVEAKPPVEPPPRPVVPPPAIPLPTSPVAPPPPARPEPPRPPAPGLSSQDKSWPPAPKLTLPPAPPKPRPPAPIQEAAPSPVEALPEEPGKTPFWKSFGQPRAAANTPTKTHPYADIAAAPIAEFSASPQPARPAARIVGEPQTSWVRAGIVTAVLGTVVAGVALLAYHLRDNPADFSRGRPPASNEAADPAAAGKIIERIGAGPRPPAQPATAPLPKPAPVAAEPTLDVAQRAALLVEAPDEPLRTKTYFGSVIWKLERPASGGLPVLIAEVDVPDSKFKAVISISSSADAASLVSQRISLRFLPGPGSPVGAVADIETPSMRSEERPAGDSLEGRPAAVTANYFLVGLIRDPVITARNLDLLKSRAWMDVPIKLESGRIAKLTFEKGVQGERLLNEALAAWQ